MDRARSSSTSSESSKTEERERASTGDELSFEALQRKFRPIGNIQEDNFGGRTRAPSVADFEVKMLLSNLSSVSESESEADSSELEMEFERIRREGLRSPRPGIHLPKSKPYQTKSKDDSEQFWLELKGNLQKQAEQLLDDNSPSGKKNRRKSWMVVAEELEKKLDKSTDQPLSPPPARLTSAPLSPSDSIHGEKTDDETRKELESNLGSLYSSSSNREEEQFGRNAMDTETDLDREISDGEDTDEEQGAETNDTMDWWASLKDELETKPEDQPAASPAASPAISPSPSASTPAPITPSKSDASLNGAPLSASSSASSGIIRTTSAAEIQLSPQSEPKPVLHSSGSNPKLSAVRSKRSSRDPMDNGMMKGHQHRGVLKFDNGVYRGETESTGEGYNTAQGWGTFQTHGGEFYVGQWAQGKREGVGIKIWDDGRQYVGQWEANRRTGNGIIAWPNGDKYIGEIQYGFQQGHGMFKSADGEKYTGEWNVNERHGYGVMNFKNGDTYSGEWLHNKKDGMGIYRFADGKYVEGEWHDNAFLKEKRKSSRQKTPRGPSDNLDSADMDKDVKNKGRAPSDPRMSSPRSDAKKEKETKPMSPRFSFGSGSKLKETKSSPASPKSSKSDAKSSPKDAKSPVTSPKGSVGRSFLRIASAKELKAKKETKEAKSDAKSDSKVAAIAKDDSKDEIPPIILQSPLSEPKEEKKEKRKMPLPFRRDKSKAREPDKTL